MKRRDFIQHSVLAASALAMPLEAISLPGSGLRSSKHITILHTNDVHSHIDPFPEDHHRNPGRGGVSRRYTLIEKVKAENPNTLILDAGDSFQGTPYFNFYGGELEFKLMSKMGYHASTIGNHEFDNGIDNIAAQLQHAQFDMLNANYDLSNTILDGMTKPHQIYEVDGVKIGIFGLGIELEGLVSKNLYKETKYLDPVDVAQEQIKILKKEQHCDLVICLSHLGYKYDSQKIDDIKLAENTSDIDLIIGGHTHTFLDRPTKVTNKSGQATLVNQVGFAGLYLGRIDFYLDSEGIKSSKEVVFEL
jgi:5'-nucleotidase